MIFLDKDIDYLDRINSDINDENKQQISAEDKMKLIARATLDKRLNARDLKLYNYVMSFEYLSFTQEEISEMLDISRSNINKSFEKLASFNYIEKVQLQKGIKKMTYKLKRLNQAGVVRATADEVIRVLNMSNSLDTKYKFKHCTLNDYKILNQTIDTYKKNIKIIEEHYDCDGNDTALCNLRDKAHSLVKIFDMKLEDKDRALTNLKDSINEIKERISDTSKMLKKIDSFSDKLVSQVTVLSKSAVKRVLEDENAKFILFIDRSDEECFVNFREKYLKDYIKFICRFSDLHKNEDFFKIYYENKTVEFTFSDFMRLIGQNHREVPVRRENAVEFIENAIIKFEGDSVKELNERAATLVQEVSDLLEIVKTNAVFNSREVALLLYVLDKRICMQKELGLSFESFVKMYNPDLLDMIIEYKKAISGEVSSIEYKRC